MRRRLRLLANWHKHSEPHGSDPIMLITWDNCLECTRKKKLIFLDFRGCVVIWSYLSYFSEAVSLGQSLHLHKTRVCKLKEQYVNIQGHWLVSPSTPTKGWDQLRKLVAAVGQMFIDLSVCLSYSKWKADRSAVTSLCVSPDGKLLLSAGQVIKMWDLDTKEVYRVSLSRLFFVFFCINVLEKNVHCPVNAKQCGLLSRMSFKLSGCFAVAPL